MKSGTDVFAQKKFSQAIFNSEICYRSIRLISNWTSCRTIQGPSLSGKRPWKRDCIIIIIIILISHNYESCIIFLTTIYMILISDINILRHLIISNKLFLAKYFWYMYVKSTERFWKLERTDHPQIWLETSHRNNPCSASRSIYFETHRHTVDENDNLSALSDISTGPDSS